MLGLPVMGRPAGSRLTAVDPAVTVLPLVVEPHLRPDDSLAAVDRALAGLRRHSGCRAEDIRRVRGVTDPDRLLTGPSLNIRPFSPLFRFGDTRATLTTISTGPVTDLEFIAQSRPDSGLDLQIIGRPTWHTHDDADRHCRGEVALPPTPRRSPGSCATPGSATWPTRISAGHQGSAARSGTSTARNGGGRSTTSRTTCWPSARGPAGRSASISGAVRRRAWLSSRRRSRARRGFR